MNYIWESFPVVCSTCVDKRPIILQEAHATGITATLKTIYLQGFYPICCFLFITAAFLFIKTQSLTKPPYTPSKSCDVMLDGVQGGFVNDYERREYQFCKRFKICGIFYFTKSILISLSLKIKWPLSCHHIILSTIFCCI